MTEKKIWTKTSVMLTLISCMALIAGFVGTTLAYFADSVTSSHNQVIAGKLAGSTHSEITI